MTAYEPSSKRVREENLLVLIFDFLHMNKILPGRLMAGVPYMEAHKTGYRRRMEDSVHILNLSIHRNYIKLYMIIFSFYRKSSQDQDYTCLGSYLATGRREI